MQTIATAVEVDEYFNEIEEEKNAYNAALARWVAGIEEDLKALDAGTLECYTPEEFEAIMDDFEK